MDNLIATGGTHGLKGAELRVWAEEEAKKARDEGAQAREADSCRLELEREVLDRKLRLEELRVQRPLSSVGSVAEEQAAAPPKKLISPHKLIPPFIEERGGLDAYIQGFEPVATSQQWPKENWASAFSLCLSGNPLTVIGRMLPDDSLDYEKFKLILLQEFRSLMKASVRGSEELCLKLEKQVAS